MSKNHDPRMHSAEHILNRTMVNIFACSRCFSAHINAKKSKCDYLFDHALSDGEIEQIQDRVNSVIEQDLPVMVEQMETQSAQKLFDIARVPQKDVLETLRVVRIGDYDACPCIGPHVTSTKQIGHFKITSTGFEDRVLRIRFKLE